MASFVESATLKVNDQSTAQINKINAALTRLFATANQLKSMRIDLQVTGRGLSQASAMVRQLVGELRALQSASKAINLNVNANTGGISKARGQIAQLRAEAAKPINLTTARQFIAGATGVGLASAGYAVGRATAAGTRQADEGAIRLRLRQLSETEQTRADEAIQAILREQRERPGGGLLNLGQLQALFAENLGVTRNNVEATKHLTQQVLESVQLGVRTGVPFQRALENAVDISKALEQSGRLTGPSGAYDKALSESSFQMIRQAQLMGGKEITGDFVRQIITLARTSRFGLSDRGMLTLFAMAEEQRASAAVGLNQMITQLTGTRIQNKQMNELMQLGLLRSREVDIGAVGKKRQTRRVAAGALEEELLRTDPVQWIAKHVIPAMRAKGLDPNSAVDAQRMASMLVSDKTAVSSLTEVILRYNELTSQVNQALATDATIPNLQNLTKDSVSATVTDLGNQIQGLFGQLIKQTDVQKMIAGVSGEFERAQIAVKEGDPLGIMRGLGIATITAGPLLAMRAMMSEDKGVASLGGAAAALTGSAAALTGAAGALAGSSALGLAGWAAQMRGAGLGGLLRAAGIVGAGVYVGSEMREQMGANTKEQADYEKRLMSQQDLLGAKKTELDLTKQIAALEHDLAAEGPAAERYRNLYGERMTRDLIQAKARLAEVRSEISKLEGAFTKLDEIVVKPSKPFFENIPGKMGGEFPSAAAVMPGLPTLDTSRKYVQTMSALYSDLGGALKSMTDQELADRKRLAQGMAKSETRNAYVQAVDAEINARKKALEQGRFTQQLEAADERLQLQRVREAQKRWKKMIDDGEYVPEDLHRMRPTGGVPFTGGPFGGEAPEGIPGFNVDEIANQFNAGISEAANPILQATAELTNVSNSFGSVFSTGAAALEAAGVSVASSGEIAAATLSGAAPGIGGTIGATAAAAIQAAVSGININVNANVNQSGGRGNTGTQTAVE